MRAFVLLQAVEHEGTGQAPVWINPDKVVSISPNRENDQQTMVWIDIKEGVAFLIDTPPSDVAMALREGLHS